MTTGPVYGRRAGTREAVRPRGLSAVDSQSTAEELALAAQGGSTAAFTGLVERFEAALFNFLRIRTSSQEDAEELLQETFLRAWQRISLYDSRWRFSTWLFTLAKRLTVSRFRRQRPDEVGGESLAALGTPADPSRIVSADEERTNLWDTATRVLSVEQRSALWLRYAEDLSSREIASVLGKREATVRVLLFRAREKLAERLTPSAPDAPVPRSWIQSPPDLRPAAGGSE